jgi:hypothetical protein
VYVLAIFIAPIALAIIFFQAFVMWKRNEFIQKQESIVLQIKIPKEIFKSPRAMELFLTSLYQTKGEGTWISKYWEGKVRPWFSLELVSMGGEVRFYIWSWKFWKGLIESQLYAQYPEIEIKEVVDYVSDIHLDPEHNDLWGCNFKLNKGSHFPIKTYVDYNIVDDPKEELKIDPITPVLEFLGSLQKGEIACIQIIIRAHKKELPKPGGKWNEKTDWSHAAMAEIEKIKNKTKGKDDTVANVSSLSKGDKDIIEAIERNISKIAFDVGVRAFYFAPLDRFNDINIAGLNGSFRQYNSPFLNSFEGDHATGFDYKWQDWSGKKLKKMKEHTLHAYQARSFFHAPDKGHYFTMNTEGIATIFHFPGQVAKTPTIQRIEAKRAEPPANLPI